ncbi:MAG: hypothetical protein WCF18_10465 [Chthoniobacteraceae bacterium]
MKTILQLLMVLAFAILGGGCASRVGIATPHHHVGVGATVR